MNHPRGGLTAPNAGKRKEREGLFIHPNPINGSGNGRIKKTASPLPSPSPSTSTPNTTSLKQKPSEPACSNRLVAGYLAHEFLTQGTLLGQKPDPAPAEAKPPGYPALGGAVAAGTPTPAKADQKKGYAEVARILKTDGAHIPGIVNPTQLTRWIQM